jgi:hypothetical protein
MALQFDVIIDMDRGPLPLGEGLGRGRQGPERRPAEGFESLPAAAGPLLEGAVVEVLEEFADRPVESGQRGEDPVPQARDPSATPPASLGDRPKPSLALAFGGPKRCFGDSRLTQRSTSSTPASTLALSRGLRTRAGTTATP